MNGLNKNENKSNLFQNQVGFILDFLYKIDTGVISKVIFESGTASSSVSYCAPLDAEMLISYMLQSLFEKIN